MAPVIHAQIIDADRHHMGRFLMTGSQKFGLMQSLSESLAGRCAILELGTLSAAEIHRAPAHADLDPLDLLWRGGLRRDSVDHPIVNWLLWIASGSPELSGAAREVFRDPANDVFLSAASAWEISLKHALGKLPLPEPPARFVPGARERHRIEPLQIDETSALTTNRLPPLHRDPFDRILIAQAIMHGLTVLTPDTAIQQYPVATAW